ncbi:MAG TPA: hypothetical protein VHY34_07760 [Caulobacteraceae bacterium]|jgi:hypothetical protein|nr:hypothetical protein [Caulobacteraceae bacterium]
MRRRDSFLAGLAAAFIIATGADRAAASSVIGGDGSVTLSPVAVPIVVDGRLANYVFVIVKVLLQPSADEAALRTKEPYFRDALVRAAYRTPFVLRYDYNHIDDARLKAVMMREAVAIAGPQAIKSIIVVEQTPEHRVPSPRAPQQAAR